MKGKIIILILVLALAMAIGVAAQCSSGGQCHMYSSDELDFDTQTIHTLGLMTLGSSIFNDVVEFNYLVNFDAGIDIEGTSTIRGPILAKYYGGKRADFGTLDIYPDYADFGNVRIYNNRMEVDSGNFIIRLG